MIPPKKIYAPSLSIRKPKGTLVHIEAIIPVGWKQVFVCMEDDHIVHDKGR